MVADGDGVVLHLVHQPYLHVALEHGVESRTLREVSAIEEQQVGVFLSFLMQHGNAAQVSTAVGQHGVGQVGIQRQDGGVRVVGVQDGQRLLRPCGAK